MITFDPGTIDVRNTIARGAVDALAEPGTTGIGCPCPDGVIDIGSSSFVTSSRITDQGHNQSGNPLFAGPSDFHLLPGSPAIDAGVNDPADGPTDVDGHARIQGTAPDLGAYEATPIPAAAPEPTPTPGPPGPPAGLPAGPTTSVDKTAPSISGLSMTHRRFADRHARGHRRPVVRGTAFSFSLSEAARVTIAIVAESSGRLSHGRCVRATRRLAHARRCTRLVGAGTLVHTAAKGRVKLAFSGRIGTRTLAPGRYRAALTAVDTAGNRSTPHTIAFTIVAG
jgi:hypothetical protein